ncbi:MULTISPECIES: DUF6445 family protein [Bradyrhizobium]|jgi:hypothetical protein|nr:MULTISPECIES: DUF6445 family protein [Bradyrhizobium]MDI2111133.1 DUF6445 family protein [Bradyrhizobium sp. Mp64]WLA52717.1 DUF6445 family protein [Bradyrhizobium elkanii]WLB04893.1 DUF6445 family protein [Bradyrhizobium elkanii]WLB14059.1 DUF6445 family protein [Bradyrhizobium elkanii]WLB76881.1 DUF6445 family protein [Bradyrhizobium elkanii]
MRLTVLDDFYPDPWAVRRYALTLRYEDAANENDNTHYKGMLTTPSHPYAEGGLGLIACALSKPLVWRTPIGEFRLLLKRKPDANPNERATWIHYDAMVASYAALVFLNLDSQCQGGTSFFRHRQLQWDRIPDLNSEDMAQLCRNLNITIPEVLETLKHDGFKIDEKWDLLTTVPMKFNRCIIFDSRQFHARTGTFGATPLDGRLTQNFFFDVLN